MKFDTIKSLPLGIQNSLPLVAQKIYISAYNEVQQLHPKDLRVNAIAHRVAWAKVKQTYERSGGNQWQQNHKKDNA